jgi:hypothetical protein
MMSHVDHLQFVYQIEALFTQPLVDLLLMEMLMMCYRTDERMNELMSGWMDGSMKSTPKQFNGTHKRVTLAAAAVLRTIEIKHTQQYGEVKMNKPTKLSSQKTHTKRTKKIDPHDSPPNLHLHYNVINYVIRETQRRHKMMT